MFWYNFMHNCFMQIHPIFMISVADLLLSLLYIVGSSLWLLGETYPPNNVLSSVNQSLSSNGACLYVSFFTTVSLRATECFLPIMLCREIIHVINVLNNINNTSCGYICIHMIMFLVLLLHFYIQSVSLCSGSI